jgi:hypothetical protein
MGTLWMTLQSVAIGCALLSWLSAAVHWLASLGQLSGKTSLSGMLFSGFAAFDGDNFNDRGRVYQRRFKLSFALFFASVLGAVLVAVVGARPA